jgi:hypothetical protein
MEKHFGNGVKNLSGSDDIHKSLIMRTAESEELVLPPIS